MLTMRPTTNSKLLVYHDELQEENTDQSVDNEYNRASEINQRHDIHNNGGKDFIYSFKQLKIV